MPVRPELDGAGQRTGAVRAPRQQRRGVLQRRVGPRLEHGPHDPGGLLEDRGAGGVDDHAAGPHGVEGRGQQRALQRHQGVEVGGLRRQRASGRRRSAPRPVQGASTSTRSKGPGGPGRAGAVGRDHAQHAVGARPARAARVRPGAAAARRASSRPSLGRQGREQRRLAAGPAHRSSQRSSRPSSCAAASASATSCEPSSCTPARPSRHGRHRARVAGGQHHAVRRPARGLAGQLLAGRPRPGRATRVTPGGALSAASSASISSSADGRGERLDHPARVGVRDGEVAVGSASRAGATRATQASRSRSATWRSTALTNPAAPARRRAHQVDAWC